LQVPGQVQSMTGQMAQDFANDLRLMEVECKICAHSGHSVLWLAGDGVEGVTMAKQMLQEMLQFYLPDGFLLLTGLAGETIEELRRDKALLSIRSDPDSAFYLDVRAGSAWACGTCCELMKHAAAAVPQNSPMNGQLLHAIHQTSPRRSLSPSRSRSRSGSHHRNRHGQGRRSAGQHNNPTVPSGYVFLCNNITYQECLDRCLFGAPRRSLGGMHCIVEGTALFLFHTGNHRLLGVFEPDGLPGLDLEPDAFEGRFCAQVRVRHPEKLLEVKLPRRLVGGAKSQSEAEYLLAALHNDQNAGEATREQWLDEPDEAPSADTVSMKMAEYMEDMALEAAAAAAEQRLRLSQRSELWEQ